MEIDDDDDDGFNLIQPSLFQQIKNILDQYPDDGQILKVKGTWGGGGTPYNGLYGDAPPERGTFFRLQVYKRIGISQV